MPRRPASGEKLRLCATDGGWLLAIQRRGMPVSMDRRGRRRVFLGKGHVYANTGGWQYLSRFLVADALGRPLRQDEHAHHLDGDTLGDLLANLELLLCEYHGRLHASAMTLAGQRGPDGRFLELEAPGEPRPWKRDGAVLGRAGNRVLRPLAARVPPEGIFLPSPAQSGPWAVRGEFFAGVGAGLTSG